MITITLKDGSTKALEGAMTAMALAESISGGLARAALAVKLDGEVCDLDTVIDKDCAVEFLTFDNDEGKKVYRHTTSHILAKAVKKLYPKTKLAIGPAIDNGFYYDFDSEVSFTPEVLEKLEAEMKKIIKENIPLKRYVLPRDEAVKMMADKGEDYKVELINDLPEG